MKTLLFLLTLVAFMLMGCGEEKMAPVPLGEMKEYKDPVDGWAIRYPATWPVQLAQAGQRARFYNDQGVDLRFSAPNEPGVNGVEISIDVAKEADIAGFAAKDIAQMKANQYQVQAEEKIDVGGVQATKVKYAANWGKNSIIYGHYIYVPKDSIMYKLGFNGFEQFYNAYAAIFDASLKSFKPAKPKEAGVDESLPSEEFETYNSKSFSFDYPSNFNSTNPNRGKFEEVAAVRNSKRLDCSVRFDVFDAKGLTLDKVFDQNKASFHGASAGSATVGGQPAKTLSYSARKDVMRKFYFVVRNGKVIRITTDWYKGHSAAYDAAYAKVIGSVKFK
jgi:hypothetical protein